MTIILAIFFGLIVFAEVAEAETVENPLPRCQQSAHDFAENPGSVNVDRLQELQSCINQILAQRAPLSAPKKFGIKSQSSSEADPLSAPQGLRIVD